MNQKTVLLNIKNFWNIRNILSNNSVVKINKQKTTDLKV